MKTLHDPSVRSDLQSRLKTLRPDAERKWGTMTPGQMLWHVNLFLSFAVGEASAPPNKPPMPPALLRFAILYLPWPKRAPTHPAAVATTQHDFEAERTRCLGLIERFVSRPIDGPWPLDPTFVSSSGQFASRLQARHLDHHFRQFGG